MSILSSLLNLGSDDEYYDWYCDECGAYMNNQLGFSSASGEWTCTECGAVNDVSESNVVYEIDDEEEIPEGCRACGGPYPDCADSCKMFDD